MTGRAERLTEIDALKVAGIVTIVLIHVLRPPWDPALSSLEAWLGHVTRFGVPAFLFASGFLYATATPNPAAIVMKRLRKVVWLDINNTRCTDQAAQELSRLLPEADIMFKGMTL